MFLLRMGVLSVGGSPLITVIRNTVMLSIVEMPRVIFSPDSAGIRKTHLSIRNFGGLSNIEKSYKAKMLMRTAG